MRRVAVVLTAVIAAPLAAQGGRDWTVSASLSALFARQAAAGDTDQNGTWVGAGLEGDWRRWTLLVREHGGAIGPAGAPTARHGRVTDVLLRWRARPGLALGIEAEALRFEQADSVAVWKTLGPTVALSTGLGMDGMTATAEVAYFPILGTADDDPLAHAARFEVGMAYRPPGSPVTLGLAFRRQTFEFSDGRAAESLGGLVLGVGVALLPR